MVELGLCAKQEKADRFQHVKKEINEMVKLRVSQLKSKMQEQQQANGSGDDFQVVGYSGALKGKFTMDNALEDKIYAISMICMLRGWMKTRARSVGSYMSRYLFPLSLVMT
ncbi:ubinuclein-2-like [Carex rostrata]